MPSPSSHAPIFATALLALLVVLPAAADIPDGYQTPPQAIVSVPTGSITTKLWWLTILCIIVAVVIQPDVLATSHLPLLSQFLQTLSLGNLFDLCFGQFFLLFLTSVPFFIVTTIANLPVVLQHLLDIVSVLLQILLKVLEQLSLSVSFDIVTKWVRPLEHLLTPEQQVD